MIAWLEKLSGEQKIPSVLNYAPAKMVVLRRKQHYVKKQQNAITHGCFTKWNCLKYHVVFCTSIGAKYSRKRLIRRS